MTGVLLVLAAAAADARLFERGQDQSRTVSVAGVGPAGLAIKDGVTVRVVPWSSVREVEGAAAAEPWVRAGNAIWRGDRRLERGDLRLARIAFEEALAACPAPGGDTRLQALDGLARTCSAQGDLAGLRAATLAESALLRSGARLPAGTGPAPHLDAEGVPGPQCPPAFATCEEAKALMDATLMPALAGDSLAAAYRRIAGEECPKQEPRIERASTNFRQAAWLAELLDRWAEACGPDAATRRRARGKIADIEMPPAYESWAKYAVARSLAMDAEAAPEASRRGAADEAALALLAVAADAGAGSTLGRSAIAQAAACLDSSGDKDSARALARHNQGTP